jgi:sugar phosphate isomerase/epimerase
MRLGGFTDRADGIEVLGGLGYVAVELESVVLGDPTAGDLDPARVDEIAERCARAGLAVSGVAYYGLADAPPAEADVPLVYERVFAAARRLGATVIGSMTGFDRTVDWHGNLDRFERIYTPLVARAEELGLRIGLENWMGYWGRMPFGLVNMGGSPATWDELFERVPSPALGLEFDPSHLAWQGIDPYRALREYAGRIHHFHAKDVELLPEARYRYGVNGDVFRFRVAGSGELDWPRLVALLVDAGFDGTVVVEHEDPTCGYEEGFRSARNTLAPLLA